ncbi:cupin domain-containing protein [Mycobacterium intermedium]|uniref:cupin domain-containing protein n=1 Tax=Mycobacterium intermedium TaxID=28445 RepID=UPI001E2C71B4|nr:cupin domain-containing protein [Mycobacterium intermedium]
MTIKDLNAGALLSHVTTAPPGQSLDVFGATVEFLSHTDEFCVMRGVVPPGAVVPLHRHADAEDFLILSGQQQVLVSVGNQLAWRDASAGDYVRIPGNVMHAHRNVTDEPAVDLIITTSRLGRFFAEIGRPVTKELQPPTAAELAKFVEASARYGYVLATPQENAAYGINMPVFSG